MRGAKEELPTVMTDSERKEQSQNGSKVSTEAQELARHAQTKHGQQAQIATKATIETKAEHKNTQAAPQATTETTTKLPPGAVGSQLGFDIFHGDVYGSYPDFKTLSGNGMKFMFAKAIEGTTYIDQTFEKNFTDAKQAGLVRGAYDFFHPEMDAAAQAQAFLKTLPPLQKGDLVALDLEGDNWSKVPKEKRIDGVLTWLNIVEKDLNITPIIYMSKDFASETFGQDADKIKDYPLWEAEYKVDSPTVPAPFPREIIWQFSETATIQGLGGHKNDYNALNPKVNLASLSTALRTKASRHISQRASAAATATSSKSQ
jgi:lysozyme